MQPTYLPWIGYFALMDMADVFVFLDDVQLAPRSWQVRNRIKRQDGDELMLSVPVRRSAARDDLLIKDAEFGDDGRWESKHLKSFEHSYKRAPYFADAMSIFEPIMKSHGPKLCDLTIGIIAAVADRVGIGTKRRLRSSEIAEKSSDRRDRLVDICAHVGADIYVSPPGSAGYLDESDGAAQFMARGIDLRYQSYEHPVYPQINGAFRSHMCILDLIANVGVADAAKVIRGGTRPLLRSIDPPAKEAV